MAKVRPGKEAGQGKASRRPEEIGVSLSVAKRLLNVLDESIDAEEAGECYDYGDGETYDFDPSTEFSKEMRLLREILKKAIDSVNDTSNNTVGGNKK